jgi:hypothetical protein
MFPFDNNEKPRARTHKGKTGNDFQNGKAGLGRVWSEIGKNTTQDREGHDVQSCHTPPQVRRALAPEVRFRLKSTRVTLSRALNGNPGISAMAIRLAAALGTPELG